MTSKLHELFPSKHMSTKVLLIHKNELREDYYLKLTTGELFKNKCICKTSKSI